MHEEFTSYKTFTLRVIASSKSEDAIAEVERKFKRFLHQWDEQADLLCDKYDPDLSIGSSVDQSAIRQTSVEDFPATVLSFIRPTKGSDRHD